MSKQPRGSLFLDYVILFSLFFIVLVVCLYWKVSPESSEVLAFSTLFGFLLLRRGLKRARKPSRRAARQAKTSGRSLRVRVQRKAQAAV